MLEIIKALQENQKTQLEINKTLMKRIDLLQTQLDLLNSLVEAFLIVNKEKVNEI